MKKNVCTALVGLLLFYSCSNNGTDEPQIVPEHEHVAIRLANIGGTGSVIYNIKTKTGHSGENCPGCVAVGGTLVHIDCMGVGTVCELSATISTHATLENGIYSMTTSDPYEFGNEDIFFMPDRSLFVEMIENEEFWMNIPEQLVVKDNETGQFILQGIYFTNYPVYTNQ